ncbi:MAG TPA: sigma-70 family RNA polymerase sigma factor [Bryobacteraceae bacterium]|jgi:RNA polymerase sigma-70 factor (ECF subfamily)
MTVLQGNDRETIEACRRGDAGAFAVLFEAHKDKVYSIALRYSGDPAAAMDLSQEVFLKLLGKLAEYRGDAHFETWLYRVVVNACLDHHRRQRKWMPLVGEFLDLFRSPKEGALHAILRDEMQQNVQRVVGKLPSDLRMVVILRYTEELSYDEIAEILGVPVGTVASRLNRAHGILERRLKQYARA